MLTHSDRPSSIPELPESGLWKHKGKLYASAKAATQLGFNSPFLEKYRKQKHPILKRKIRSIRLRLWMTCGESSWRRVQRVYLYLLTDLKKIKAARDRAENHTQNGHAAWPTMTEAAKQTGISYDTLHDMEAKGKIASIKDTAPITVTTKRKRNGKILELTYVAHVKCKRLCPEDLAKLKSPPPNSIALAEASRKSGIPYETWYWWTQQENCSALGAKLESFIEGTALTEDGRYRDTLHIATSDYETIVKRAQSEPGRLTDEAGTWLAAETVDADYKLPRLKSWPSTILRLKQVERRALEVLGRPIMSKLAFYLDSQKRWVYRRVYHEEDIARLFRRKRPAPPATAPVAQPNGQDSTQPTPAPAPLLTTATTAAPVVKETRKKRAREKHLEWKRRQQQGKSPRLIALEWTEETEEETTEDTVKKALKRLPPGGGQ